MRFADIWPGLASLLTLAQTERSQVGGKPAEVTPAPAKPTTIYECPNFQLNSVREKLANVDQSIARILVDFRQASEYVARPDSKLLSRVKLPQDIEEMAIDSNTPRELFTGVMQFLALKVQDDGRIVSQRYNRDLTAQFKSLCEELVERHNLSRTVYDIKKSHPEICERDDANNVVTFKPEQHEAVVNRMHQFCTNSGSDRDLGALIIDWVASANAGWQDQAINQNTGPFVNTQKQAPAYEMRYPC